MPCLCSSSKCSLSTVHGLVCCCFQDGSTALLVAAAQGQEQILTLLLLAGARADVKNKAGKRAIDLAMEYHQHECVAILVRINNKGGTC